VVAGALERGVVVTGLSAFHAAAPPPRPGLVLGYAQLTEPAIAEGIRRVGEAVRAARGGPSAVQRDEHGDDQDGDHQQQGGERDDPHAP
jgi:hypothetical protein